MNIIIGIDHVVIFFFYFSYAAFLQLGCNSNFSNDYFFIFTRINYSQLFLNEASNYRMF